MKNLLLIFALSIAAPTSMLAAQPADSARFYFNKGLEEKTAKRYLVASQAFDKALQHNPSFIDAYLESGYTALEMRKTDQAKAAFTKVYELDPNNKAAIKELTSLYFSYRQFEKAIEFAGKCKDCENLQRLVGMSYYQLEDYPAAAKALTNALNSNPNDGEAAYTLARSYLDMEDYKKAVPFYEKAVAMPGARNNWMYELGLLYYTVADYKNSVASFLKAAENGYVQSNDFKENLGYSYIYSGEYDKGEALLLVIWQRKPGNKDILRDLAQILYEQKQYDRSLGYCQKLMELDPKDGKALYQAGLCFQKKGQKDRGMQMCDKAIEMDPSLESLRKKKEIPGM
jgi:tetratricopeptide (TPR) repeat protein